MCRERCRAGDEDDGNAGSVTDEMQMSIIDGPEVVVVECGCADDNLGDILHLSPYFLSSPFNMLTAPPLYPPPKIA